MQDCNILVGVGTRGGWAGILTGENLGKSLMRAVPRLNDQGYRVVQIIPDEWSFFKQLASFILAILTLGFLNPTPGLLIVAERIATPVAGVPVQPSNIGVTETSGSQRRI